MAHMIKYDALLTFSNVLMFHLNVTESPIDESECINLV